MRFSRLAFFAIASVFLLPAFAAAEATSGTLRKTTDTLLRVLSYNTDRNFLENGDTEMAFQRILRAVQPDVIAFQEIAEHPANNGPDGLARKLEEKMKSFLPASNWHAWVGITDAITRNAIVSRFPLSMTIGDTTPPSEVRGVDAALVNLPEKQFAGNNLYLMNVNFKAGDDSGPKGAFARRQKHADSIINWILDARTPSKQGRPAGDQINLKARTPILVAGDFHFSLPDREGSGPYHAMHTLLFGDIYDTKTYGLGALPDWDGTSLSSVVPGVSGPKGLPMPLKIAAIASHFFYTDAVIHPVSCVLVNSATMPPHALLSSGMQAGDTTKASRHLPVFADFNMGPAAIRRPADGTDGKGGTASKAGAANNAGGMLISDDNETGPTLPSANP